MDKSKVARFFLVHGVIVQTQGPRAAHQKGNNRPNTSNRETKSENTVPRVCRAGFSWWEAWGQLVGGQCPAIT